MQAGAKTDPVLRSVTPGATNIAGQTGSTYQLTSTNFPTTGTFLLVEFQTFGIK